MSGKSPTTKTRTPGLDDVRAVLEELNRLTGSRFAVVNSAGKPTSNAELVKQRIKEADVETCLGVVRRKVAEWGEDDGMRQYLRPATLFARRKFEQYAGQAGTPRRQKNYGSFLDETDRVVDTQWRRED